MLYFPKLPDEYRSLLDQSGISLQNPGLQERALRRDDALYAVTLMRGAGVPISGGDVYVRCGDSIKLAYNDWSVKRTDSLEESWVLAENYIKNYPDLGDGEPVFVLVLGRH